MGAFREKLLYVIGYDVRDGVQHMRVLNMTFRNAGEECLRIKYFARHNEIAYSTFHDCGIWDFVFDAHGVVGEAIYLGTSSKQWDINLTIEPDVTAYNWVHHNVIDTQGNECVEAKEGTEHNVIEYNLCRGQKDPNSGGIVSRGKANIIRYNEIHGSVGAGVRLGGHLVDGVQYGVDNLVYGNIITENDAGGIKGAGGTARADLRKCTAWQCRWRDDRRLCRILRWRSALRFRRQRHGPGFQIVTQLLRDTLRDILDLGAIGRNHRFIQAR